MVLYFILKKIRRWVFKKSLFVYNKRCDTILRIARLRYLSVARILWKLCPKTDRRVLLSRLNALDQMFYWDLFNNKQFPGVFDNRRSIFIHVPKCAGTSISDMFYDGHAGGHRAASWYQQRFPQKYQQYFTFSISRNPWDRLVSAYSYLKKDSYSSHTIADSYIVEYSADFERFVMEWISPENIMKSIFFVPQHMYMEDRFGIISLDYVGKLEQIDSAMQHVAERLGIRGEVLHSNSSRDDCYADHYTDEMIEKVRSVYSRDCELFGYGFLTDSLR